MTIFELLVGIVCMTWVAYLVGHEDGRDAEAADIIALIESRD